MEEQRLLDDVVAGRQGRQGGARRGIMTGELAVGEPAGAETRIRILQQGDQVASPGAEDLVRVVPIREARVVDEGAVGEFDTAAGRSVLRIFRFGEPIERACGGSHRRGSVRTPCIVPPTRQLPPARPARVQELDPLVVRTPFDRQIWSGHDTLLRGGGTRAPRLPMVGVVVAAATSRTRLRPANRDAPLLPQRRPHRDP